MIMRTTARLVRMTGLTAALVGLGVAMAGQATAAPSGAGRERLAPVAAVNQGPPAGFRSWEQVRSAQEPLSAAANRLYDKARQGTDGYAGIQVSVENGRVVLFWHGDLPKAMVDAVAAERAGGVNVRTAAAAYTERELTAKARSVLRTRLVRDGAPVEVHTAGANADGSGVTVAVHRLPRAEARVLTAASALPAKPAIDVPVTVVTEDQPETTWGRERDVVAYKGGAMIRRVLDGICTTGLSVRWNGKGYLLTAALCGLSGKVTSVGQWSTWTDPFDGSLHESHVNRVKSLNDEIIAMEGDSGGPVYSEAADGVYARGLLHALAGTQYACSNPAANNATVACGKSVYVTDLGDATGNYPGMTLVTG
jgi:hypothetical protein